MTEHTPERIALVLMPRFNMLSLASAIEPMRIANYLSPRTLYAWTTLSAAGGRLPASNGMEQQTEALDDNWVPSRAFVFGSWGAENHGDEALTRWLRLQSRRGVPMVAIELGLYALARAGLIANRRATTHWSWMPGFAERYPDVEMREQMRVADGKITSCAGGAGPIDLVLDIIAASHGERLANEVAEQMMHYPVRPPETPQRHRLGAASDRVPADLREAVRLIESRVEDPIPVPEIAARIGVSQRQLERLFKRHIGCSAVQFSQLLRLQHARVLLTSTKLSIRDVSAAAGFNSLSYFSQAFTRCFGRKPSEYRQAWPDSDAAPSWPGSVSAFIGRIGPRAERRRSP